MTDRILLAASYDLKIHAYNLADCSPLGEYEINNSQANRIVVSANRFYAAAYTFILSYDATGKNLKPLHSISAHDSNVTDICVTPTTLFSCSEDKTIKTWDRRTASVQQHITTTSSLSSMLILSNGYEIITGNEEGEVTVWDTRNSSSPFKMANVKSPVMSLSMSPQGQHFVASYMDGTTVRYKLNGNRLTEEFKIQAHDEIVLRCAHSPDGQLFATTSGDNSTKLWACETGEQRKVLKSDDDYEWIWDASFTSDSKRLCTGSSDGVCRVWDVDSGNLLMQTEKLEKCITTIAIVP
ncbi:WD repeat protein [Tritrichomonas foetus]|uniref:WD repeat protein n=1 Tax=Tritrichomonas foetus TaxID=1144522 RepID=A0A1J4K8M1_9EUKA|nr:WD repeat protein [Tritrichomonas foetus]|eukprot:OHT07314.1 WD repeat protein [Tritrichomonas foetus]